MTDPKETNEETSEELLIEDLVGVSGGQLQTSNNLLNPGYFPVDEIY